MKGIEKIIASLLFVALLTGCNKQQNRFQSTPTVFNDSAKISIIRMDLDVYHLDDCITKPARIGDYEKMVVDMPQEDSICLSRQLNEMEKKYGERYYLYLQQLGAMAGAYNVPTTTLFYLFLSHPAYNDLYKSVEKEYTEDVSDLENGFTTAFSRGTLLIDGFNVPQVCTFFSGFAEYIAADSSTIYLSLEYFLGKDFENYKYVPGIYDYMIPNLRREKIVPDAVYSWLCSEYPLQKEAGNLLDNMVQYGKMLYATQALLPDTDMKTIMGYSEEEWEWCEVNEKSMWNYLREYNQLFSTDAKTIADYIYPASCTKYFSDEQHQAPSRAVLWMGLKIVSEYMEKNEKLTLTQLLTQDVDAQQILQMSRYNP